MTPLARNENLVVQISGDELLVYDLNVNKAICLNETSAFIWRNCDGKKTINEIQKAFELEFGELITEDFIKFALSQLKKENLIENKDEVVIGFNGISRRDVIKKVGLSSMIALPIVASLAAPKAVHAQSCLVGSMCSCAMVGTIGTTCGDGDGVTMCPTGCMTCTINIDGTAMGTCS